MCGSEQVLTWKDNFTDEMIFCHKGTRDYMSHKYNIICVHNSI